MDEYSAKKIGEVVAFARVGKETLERGKEALISVFGQERFTSLLNAFGEQERNALDLVADSAPSLTDVVLTKAQKTSEKLQQMRDMYVQDEWDNPIELLEWSGFFQGAALVHWAFVSGSAERLGLMNFQELAHDALQFHATLLVEVRDLLRQSALRRT